MSNQVWRKREELSGRISLGLKRYYSTHDVWNKGKKCPQISEALRGRVRSEEEIRKTSESLKEWYKTHLPVCGVCLPDIVFPDKRLAVFCDGIFFHSKSFKNGKVWKKDKMQNKVLRKKGWKVLRFWGHEINQNVSTCVDQIIEKLGGDLN